MALNETRLKNLLAKIDAAGEENRHHYYHALSREIHELKDAGVSVPVELRTLAEDMLQEMVEARFDNMPV